MTHYYNQSTDIKQVNRHNIFRLLWLEKQSKKTIMEQLGLSLPTVTQNIEELMAEGLVIEDGQFKSTGGRGAKAYIVNSKARHAIGIDINSEHLAVVVMDLSGEIVAHQRQLFHSQELDTYYQLANEIINQLLIQEKIKRNELLGIGVSLQGMVSEDQQRVVYGPLMNLHNQKLSLAKDYLPDASAFFHDADSAAFAEKWLRPKLINALYLSLSTNLGGALIINQEIVAGNHFMAGKVEHMTLIPNGLPCYCGQRGCAEVYCSVQALIGKTTANDLASFFELVEEQDQLALQTLESYLSHLSILLNNLFMLTDSEIILGGYMASFLAPYLDCLKEKSYERSSLPETWDYIQLAYYQHEPIAAGAALYYVNDYLETI